MAKPGNFRTQLERGLYAGVPSSVWLAECSGVSWPAAQPGFSGARDTAGWGPEALGCLWAGGELWGSRLGLDMDSAASLGSRSGWDWRGMRSELGAELGADNAYSFEYEVPTKEFSGEAAAV